MEKSTKHRIISKIMLVTLILSLLFGVFFGIFLCFYPVKYKNMIVKECQKYNLDVAFVFALINAESRFNPSLISKKGAMGLMQLMPQTATFVASELNYEHFDIDSLLDPQTNITFGTFYLDYLSKKFNDRSLVVCAYNAGETVTRNWLKNKNYSQDGTTLNVVPYSQTKKYLQKINSYYKVYSKIL